MTDETTRDDGQPAGTTRELLAAAEDLVQVLRYWSRDNQALDGVFFEEELAALERALRPAGREEA